MRGKSLQKLLQYSQAMSKQKFCAREAFHFRAHCVAPSNTHWEFVITARSVVRYICQSLMMASGSAA